MTASRPRRRRRHGQRWLDHKALITARVDLARRADKHLRSDLKPAVAR